ncbi:LolA family protein [Spirilliplanes yamanashiensis]|uniref:MucB/RseB N-terminal domain-containing protein n=1 Tax=Spirilliplanes yamanashiensis TaxID=42233 RepID=A0A8J3Y4X6_9ACTN|nr:sigma-E factor regulatory protein RseB domain-containing protein [Spirilliplanes yamanashiensis]MDP9819331.1 outer membrane lipoprotein-sorting protein [Spirilliplanes yamanashiensis]GIJ01846.1 hypothetical protein Sya03_11980 [Spirilliplanes yamanashiensis]
MASLTSRPALRWLVPAAAAALVIGGGAAAGTIVANADPALPERSAAQLLADLQTAEVAGLSGTVVQRADLGLPPLTGLPGGNGEAAAQLTNLVAGSNTVRVWYAGEQKARVAVLSALGEMDVIRNGTDVWFWNSKEKSATHLTVPADAGSSAERRPAELPATPQAAADAALAAIDPTTKVTTTGTAEVAGRDAYELVLAPRDTASLIGQVRMAIDAEHKIPLRVEVYAKDAVQPAFKVAFEQVDFAVPDAEQFAFNPPPGTKVTDEAVPAEPEKAGKPERTAPKAPAQRDAAEGGPTVIGTGWTSIVVAKADVNKAAQEAGDQAEGAAVTQFLNALPKVSGAWGSGNLLQSALFSVLVTDDGRILAGAVAPEKLYEAAAKK